MWFAHSPESVYSSVENKGTGNNIVSRTAATNRCVTGMTCARGGFVCYFVQGFVLLQAGKVIFGGDHSH